MAWSEILITALCIGLKELGRGGEAFRLLFFSIRIFYSAKAYRDMPRRTDTFLTQLWKGFCSEQF